MKQVHRPLAYASCAAMFVLGASCSRDADSSSASKDHHPVGSLHLALNVEGLTVDQVDLTISSENLDPVVERNRSIDVADPNATVSATEAGLPQGSYTVELAAQAVDDPDTDEDESQIACEGAVSGVEVLPGEITAVDDLVLVCTRDGGQLLTSGGISITAETSLEEINTCGDLAQELSVAPLDTSVGGSVSLLVAAAPDVIVQWEASAGTIAVDGSSYTCPDVAGTYLLEATLVRADGCTQVFEQQIACHSTYEGTCGALPEQFVFEGTCGMRSPCHLVQDGCDWEVTCRGQSFAGEGEADGFPFYYTNGDLCSAELVDGELVGTCTNEAGEVCDFNTNSEPEPVVYCASLPDTIAQVSACGASFGDCEVIQDGCRYQVSCDDGEHVLSGSVAEDTLVWDFPTEEGENMRCRGDITPDGVTGTCTQRGRGLEDPRTCDDFIAAVTTAPSACEETLPSEGFVLAGCGIESTCIALQRGCLWELNCGGTVVGGTSSASNSFDFELNGRTCSGSVVAGELEVGCTGEADSCSLETIEPVVDDSCYQLAESAMVRGCGFGAPTAFFTVQHGCDFQAYAPSRQVSIVGTAGESGLEFPGFAPGWECYLDLNEEAGELWGNCLRDNDDGTVSECRDLSGDQGASLVLSYPE